ncbi:MAG: hypothetical protein RJB45_1847, partial [Pseudomonadota bacterium]
ASKVSDVKAEVCKAELWEAAVFMLLQLSRQFQ